VQVYATTLGRMAHMETLIYLAATALLGLLPLPISWFAQHCATHAVTQTHVCNPRTGTCYRKDS
jgi:hypothetical protein